MKKQAKEKARRLRKRGFSIQEIANLLNVSKSSVSLWVRDIVLNRQALERLKKISDKARQKAVRTNKNKAEEELKETEQKIRLEIAKIKDSKELRKLLCSFLYWCEGGKEKSSVRFANSDPMMIKTFLYLFRSSFKVDEKKFRICLHLHEYHNEQKQKRFWSKVTNIPATQFLKIYKKSNTGKNKKKGYPGCVSIRYHDYKMAMKLRVVWEQMAKKYGRVG